MNKNQFDLTVVGYHCREIIVEIYRVIPHSKNQNAILRN